MTLVESDRSPSRRTGVLLLLVVLAVDLIFMPKQICPGDESAWRLEARNVLLNGRLWIDPRNLFGEPGQYFVRNDTDGHWYSKFGIVNTLMSMPTQKAELIVSGSGPVSVPTVTLLLNLWNIFLSLLVAAVLYVITGRYTRNSWRRFAYVLACLFATFLWNYQRAQGSEIYQVLFFAAAYECMLRGLAQRRWIVLAWFFIGLLVLTRVFFGILIPAFALFGFAMEFRHGRLLKSLPALVLPPILIVALLGWINDIKFGSPWLSGYHQWRPEEHLPIGSWSDGIYGLLFSGHWSIFTYFPVLLIALPGMKRFASERREDFLLIASTFVLTLLTLSRIPSWRGEWSYGPRYMLFLLPILSLPALCLEWKKQYGWWMIALAGLLFSLALQFEVNSADFWFFYQVQQPLDKQMDKEMAQYFFDHHEGIIIHDLSSHRNDLDDSLLFRILSTRLSPDELARYRELVSRELKDTNYYWWTKAN